MGNLRDINKPLKSRDRKKNGSYWTYGAGVPALFSLSKGSYQNRARRTIILVRLC